MKYNNKGKTTVQKSLNDKNHQVSSKRFLTNNKIVIFFFLFKIPSGEAIMPNLDLFSGIWLKKKKKMYFSCLGTLRLKC